MVELLKSAEGWEGLSAVGKMVWMDELNSTASEAWTFFKNYMNKLRKI